MRSKVSALCFCTIMCVALLFSSSSLAATIKRASTAPDGTQGTSSAYGPDISGNGKLVVFQSGSSNLVPGDTNGNGDIFLRDLENNTIKRVSVTSAGAEANNASGSPRISADGKFVVFQSNATNLDPVDNDLGNDVYIYDVQNELVDLLAIDTGGGRADAASLYPDITADGGLVVFQSYATDLVAGDDNGACDIFLSNPATHAIQRISVDSNENQSDGSSSYPVISENGMFVAFTSGATNLVAGDTNACNDIFVRDLANGTTERISVSSAGAESDNSSSHPSISADGRYVAFYSSATNLVAGDTNGLPDIFVHDTQTGTTTRVSVSSANEEADNGTLYPSISPDGRYVTFQSFATNFIDNDDNGVADIYIHDTQTGTTLPVSINAGGTIGDSGCEKPVVSGSPYNIAFSSGATNLVTGDDNNRTDVFVSTLPTAPAPSSTVPTMSEWGMIIMAALMALSALVMRRKRATA